MQLLYSTLCALYQIFFACNQCHQILNYKVAKLPHPHPQKVTQKVATLVITKKAMFSKKPKIIKYLGYFTKEICYQELFKKLPNLITLLAILASFLHYAQSHIIVQERWTLNANTPLKMVCTDLMANKLDQLKGRQFLDLLSLSCLMCIFLFSCSQCINWGFKQSLYQTAG